ncbi:MULTISPECIES: GyrI-like domain-containing protein [Roseobacteraceae]|uniref:GyrI-like small molecule binding domain protein n=1 Tax=Pseudosulfitobacter pseudonitzschiae TaxID=1402135 RepID=A0A221JX49_9RHOB|nr:MULTISPECIES: GyrI-like domain-containing protein [Roseobacteraceae]ASM71309.1 GyrI-like small molecule binding domain protein [Pseudosulfitobacter pseudonitzschiae]
MLKKIDFKKTMKTLFNPPAGEFVEIDLPETRFVMIDGAGDPNVATAYSRALEWLYSTSYAMKFSAKNTLNRDYVVPPLEGLWWADDPKDFVRRNKDAWQWTMMIMIPEFVTDQMFAAAREGASKKLGEPPDTLRVAPMHEGLCLQTMHIGSYDDEGPTLARLHDIIMPERKLTFNGPHHEIYISDPRRVAKDRLKTVLRQPVKPI